MPSTLKRAAAFGAAFGLIVSAAIAAAYWFANRPKPWDSSSITCKRLAVIQIFDWFAANAPNGEARLKGKGFELKFILENHTSTDYTVPQNLQLFARDDRTSALDGFKVKFDHAFPIPAKERAEVDATTDFSCVDEDEAGKQTDRPAQECYDDDFGHVAGFVGFDSGTHFKLDLPKPTFANGTASATTILGR